MSVGPDLQTCNPKRPLMLHQLRLACRRWPRYLTLLAILLTMLPLLSHGEEEEKDSFPDPIDTQRDAPRLTTPAEALAAIQVPEGFEVTLFAAEPDVRQPIGFTTDARGRLWVAENYTYAERPVVLEKRQRDRIVILEDSDQDGEADRRTVFWDKAMQLTSVEVGMGGVWAMCPPQLLFIPDADGDDRPDSEPIVVLDGFELGASSHHNFANGLKWGPDGWLYGRNGISNDGHVGLPGTPDNQRIVIGPGIWRFHPQSRQLEMFCSGTTNPWGHDWDDHGELFFINTVIGHLWHALPGAHFKRMFGPDHNAYVYELLDHNADHVHWDTAEAWHETKKEMSPTTDAAGGGHAHSGMMIYLGGNWPDRYRGELYTVNLHGQRLNQDSLKREGATYTGIHAADFLFSKDPWFRGIELIYGADGGVYIADWSDVGECHENDGVHRSSGRIYKVIYGQSSKPKRSRQLSGPAGLAGLSNSQLVKLQLESNDWYVRQSRQLLQFRAAQGQPMESVHRQLRQIYSQNPDTTRRLRAIWSLHVTGGADTEWLLEQLTDEDEHVRRWAVQLLVESGEPGSETISALASTAQQDESGLVLCYLAAALQRIPADQRFPIARALVNRQEFAADRVLPVMLWYGIEGSVTRDPMRAARLAIESQQVPVRRYISRRLAEDLDRHEDAVDVLIAVLPELTQSHQSDILSGLYDALQAWPKAAQPASWLDVQQVLAKSPSPQVQQLTRQLGVVFGDGRGLEELQQIAASREFDSTVRQAAIRSLVTAKADNLLPLLQQQLGDRDVVVEAVHGIARLNPDNLSEILLAAYGNVRGRGREAIIDALATRPAHALALVEAISDEQIDRRQVPVFHIRQMQRYENPPLLELVKQLWPQLQPISADKQQRIDLMHEQLNEKTIAAADASAGRLLWDKSCGKCHKLFGSGGTIAPDLTGSQRSSMQYLLENIVDPSATLAESFRTTSLLLTDGRTVDGVILRKTEQTWELQTATERVIVRTTDIDESRPTKMSLMPEGLLDVLNDKQRADLFAYLMSSQQVALPAGSPVPPDDSK